MSDDRQQYRRQPVVLSVRVTPQLVERLDAVARISGDSRSGVARLWLAERAIRESDQQVTAT